MKRFELKDKIVAVTGATSGIGLACAKAFAKEGAKVALLGRSLEKLTSAADQVRGGNGRNAAVFQLELQNISRIPSVIDDIQDQLGPIDVLINNAGYAVAGLTEDCPVEQYKKNFEVNFFAAIALIQAVVPDMKKKRSGQIINVSSGVGKRALPGFSSYCSTKFALNGLTESLRLELAPWDIDVISISPGRVASNFHNTVQFYGRWKMQIPEMNMRTPEMIAQMILKASQNRRREATAFGPGLIGCHLNYWAPRLVDWLLARKYPVAPSPLEGEGRGEGGR